MDWRIYYADGSTFDSSQGSHLDAPGDGVLVIVYTNDFIRELTGRFVLNEWDYYIYHEAEQEWYGHNISGLRRWLEKEGIVKLGKILHTIQVTGEQVDILGLERYLVASGLVKFGEVVNNEAYRQAHHLAVHDEDFPMKSGYLTGEKRP